MGGSRSPSPPPSLKLRRAGRPSPVKMQSMLALRRSQRRVRAPGLQGRGFSFPVANCGSWRLPRGSAVAEAKADREGESSPVAKLSDHSSGRTIHGSWENQGQTRGNALVPVVVGRAKPAAGTANLRSAAGRGRNGGLNPLSTPAATSNEKGMKNNLTGVEMIVNYISVLGRRHHGGGWPAGIRRSLTWQQNRLRAPDDNVQSSRAAILGMGDRGGMGRMGPNARPAWSW
jgi:hypothetical protein